MLLLAAFALVVGTAVVTLPARLLPLLVKTDPLLVSALSGTVWSGRAGRAVLVTDAGPVHLGSLRWRLRPLSLLLFSPRIAVDAQWGQQQLRAEFQERDGVLRLKDVDAKLDARLLRQLVPIELRGRMGLEFARLDLGAGTIEHADGRLLWQEAAWVSPGGARPLGTFLAVLNTAAPGQVSATLQTLAGPVRVEGGATVNGLDYAVNARISTTGPMDPELERALSLVASPGENGYLLRLDGALTLTP